MKEIIQVEGNVTEVLPGTKFKVEIDDEHILLAHISGKMRMNYIKILPGDKVIIEMSPYDLTKGRIVRRGQQWKLVETYRNLQKLNCCFPWAINFNKFL